MSTTWSGWRSCPAGECHSLDGRFERCPHGGAIGAKAVIIPPSPEERAARELRETERQRVAAAAYRNAAERRMTIKMEAARLALAESARHPSFSSRLGYAPLVGLVPDWALDAIARAGEDEEDA